MLTIPQQFTETITKANRILIAFRQGGDGDAIASALALQHLLEKMGKHEVAIVSHDFTPPKHLSFLPRLKDIQSSLSGLQKFTIELNTEHVKLKDFSYDIQDKKLRIFLTPEEGFFHPEDIAHRTDPFTYDCIITLNTPDLAALGDVHKKHADLFYKTPTINIDHDPANEGYGQINMVDMTAIATGEVLFSIIEHIGKEHLDKMMATYLLTSVIAATKSFRTPRITPHILQMTSECIAHGADREQIMQHLYRTRSVATLKLWGRVLARLEHDTEKKFAWSSLTASDFERTGATEEHLADIVDELIGNTPDITTTLLLYEKTNADSIVITAEGNRPVTGILSTHAPYSALTLCNAFAPKGSKERATFSLQGMTLREAEKEVVEKIRAQLMTGR